MKKTDQQLIDVFKKKNKRVIEYYEGDNIWRTLGIERQEERHSAFIAWILKQDWDKEYAPIKRLLAKLGVNAPITIKKESSYIIPEKKLGELSVIYPKDELDIYAWIETENIGNIELIIENKIDSPEGLPKKNDTFKLFQTERYYEALKNNNRKKGLPKPAKQFFVFLSPYKSLTPKDKNFKSFTYQNLIVPIFEEYLKKIDKNTITGTKIIEYLRNLSNNHKNKTAIAMPTEEERLLISFFDKNKEIFRRSLELNIKNNKNTNLQPVLDALNVCNSHQYKFTISNYSGTYGMYEVIGLFTANRLEELIKEGKTDIEAIEMINSEINGYIYKRNGQRVNVSLKQNEVEYSTRNGKRQEIEYKDKEHNNRIIYITNQWSFSGSNANFKSFMENVKKVHQDFEIQEK